MPRKRILQGLHHVLERPELADLIIPDLARWEDWSQADRLAQLFKDGDKTDVLAELATLADIAANALYADKTRGGNAEYVQYGTSTSLDGTEVSEFEIADEQSPQWAKAQLTLRCGYYHSQTGR